MGKLREHPHPILPRIIRLRDAPHYLGMDKNRFNKEVRPMLNEIRIGKQGVAFDRLDLDDWVVQNMGCNGRRPKASELEDDVCKIVESQNATECRDSALKVGSGKLKNAVNMPKTAGSVKARVLLAALRQKKS